MTSGAVSFSDVDNILYRNINGSRWPCISRDDGSPSHERVRKTLFMKIFSKSHGLSRTAVSEVRHKILSVSPTLLSAFLRILC